MQHSRIKGGEMVIEFIVQLLQIQSAATNTVDVATTGASLDQQEQ